MSANKVKVRARFGPETRFDVQPAPLAPFRAMQQDRFEGLRSELVAEKLREPHEVAASGLVRRAANEAAALAWVTPFPLLVFPALFDEMYETALFREERQEQVRQRSRELLAV